MDNSVRNGMALPRLCHWTFDEGLLGVSARYAVPRSVARQLAQSPNVAGHLLTLEGRNIIGPGEQSLWPDPDTLARHRREVWLGAELDHSRRLG